GGTCMILNVDGSSIGNPGVFGFGGLIRNSNVYHGLALAWELDIKELWCYSDSKTVIKLLADPVND
ncbi:ribonuclease H, partial [Trifolium pratense]